MTAALTQSTLPVLTYHSIDDSGSVISTTPAEFRRQITLLASAGWRTLTIDAALDGLRAGRWPARSLLVTFDDGYRNVAEQAIPVLADCGYGAVIFVVSGCVGRTPQWARQPEAVANLPLLDWPALRDLASRGFALGAHTHTHPSLPALSEDEVVRELATCKSAIEQHCGVQVSSLAYPYGDSTAREEALSGSRFQAIFGTKLGLVTPRSRATQLERIDAYYLRGASWIGELTGARARAHFRVRRAARRLRRSIS